MKQYKQLLNELPSKSVVFAFGRFNPPTTGHELLMNVVKRLAMQKRADHIVFASKSQNAKKDPLPIAKKIKYLKMMFPRVNFVAANDDMRTFIEACVKLHNMGYKNVVMVAGSDRYQEFKNTLNKYNGKKGLRHGFYKFDTIEVISSGQRDADSDNADGMSGTKMRGYATKGDLKQFKKGLPSTMREIDARRLMNDVRMGMNMPAVREEINLVNDNLRERYFREEVFNVGDLVESNQEIYQIIKRGSNHLLVRDSEGQLVSKWIQDVKEVEMNEAKEKGLTNKTIRKTDRIKVARMIAMMLGVQNPETGSPENLVNQGLRKVRTKALNPEALRLVKKIIDLAKDYEIKYDSQLLPTKLKEGVMQPSGDTKVGGDLSTPVSKKPSVAKVDKKKKNNIAGDILSPTDYRRLNGGKISVTEEENKETESDLDAENQDAPAHTEVGGLMHPPYSTRDDNLRRRKVMYQRNEDVDATKKALAKAKMTADHEREKLALKKQHQREREMMSKEEVELDEKLLATLPENAAVRKKASKSGVSYSTLMKVYKRGVAAWNSGHRPGTTPQQWGLARVNSYISKGKTYHTADKDLREAKAVPKDKESGEPKKYVAGLSKSTAKARAAHWRKMDKLDDKDPKAYEPAPGDANAKTKESKYTKAYKAKYGEAVSPEQQAAIAIAKKEKMKKEAVKPNSKVHAAGEKPRDEKWEMHKESVETPQQKHARHTKDLDSLERELRQKKQMDPEMQKHINDRRKKLAMDKARMNEEVEMCPCCDCVASKCTCSEDCKGCDCNSMNESVRDYEKDIHITDFTDTEIDKMVMELDWDDILDEYDEDELIIVDDETGEEVEADEEEKELEESALFEVLSRAERIKMRFKIRRTKAKRQRAMKIALKRRSTSKVVNKRARRLAVKAVKKRFLQGRNPAKLSVGEKERIERIVAKRKSLINRIAIKMVPKIRQLEKKRVTNAQHKRK